MIQTFDSASHQTATAQVQCIKSLSGKGATAITVVDSVTDRPAGCVAFPVSAAAAVFLHVKGRIDLDAEIAKAKTKLAKSQAAIAKTSKILADKAYQEKVAEATKEADAKRLKDQESEARHLEGTIEQFKALKLEA